MPLYDSPAATPTPPVALKHHHHHHPTQRRSESPLPHLTTLLPNKEAHHLHQYHHQYSPSTRAADVSRLLDPAYASSASSGSSSSASPTHPTHHQPRAYVDHHGDLHDPDYRDFPVIRSTTRSRPTRRRTTNGPPRSRSTSRGRYSSYSMTAATARPSWERDWSTEIEDDDEEDEVDEDTESQSHFSPFATPPRRSASGQASPSYAYASYMPSPRYSQYYSESATPMPMAASPAASLEDIPSEQTAPESPFYEDEEADAFDDTDDCKKPPRRSLSISRNFSRKSRQSCASAMGSPPREVGSEKTAPRPENSRLLLDDIEFVPTCTHSLRQQWTAILLRIRFGLFHAQQRFARQRRRRT